MDFCVNLMIFKQCFFFDPYELCGVEWVTSSVGMDIPKAALWWSKYAPHRYRGVCGRLLCFTRLPLDRFPGWPLGPAGDPPEGNKQQICNRLQANR